MGSPDGSNDTTHTPPPLSFYNTFNTENEIIFFLSSTYNDSYHLYFSNIYRYVMFNFFAKVEKNTI